MRLRDRYKRLTLWNKLAAWGALASILAILIAVIIPLWHTYQDRADLRIEIIKPILYMSGDKPEEDWLGVGMHFSNLGSQPTSITQVRAHLVTNQGVFECLDMGRLRIPSGYPMLVQPGVMASRGLVLKVLGADGEATITRQLLKETSELVVDIEDVRGQVFNVRESPLEYQIVSPQQLDVIEKILEGSRDSSHAP
ncbi:MAG: hypothetical protein ABIK83_00295 [Candidatus Zixiibacteriota bacterium]